MELTQKINCRTRVVATLQENGDLSVKAFAEAEYAKGCTTTAEVSGGDISPAEQEAVTAALGQVLKSATGALGSRIGRSIHKSAEVAAALGEI